jgi:hypothetical protein
MERYSPQSVLYHQMVLNELNVDDEVTVIDCSNYKSEFRENCPFKAKVIRVNMCQVPTIIVKSQSNREYELYDYQILETGGNPKEFE